MGGAGPWSPGPPAGSGHATARELSRQGAAVALVGRREDRLTELAAEISAEVGTGLVVPADLTDPRAAADAVDRTVEGLGRLDTLVDNAGLMLLGPAAVPHLAKAAADGPRRVAGIVNIGSVAGRVAFGMSAAYCATKFGVGAFSEALRQELTGRHVRVSVVEPGSVDTELRTHNPDAVQEQLNAYLGDIERLQGQDIADTVSYIVTRPRHVSIAELLVRPTGQQI
ncbi:SDR family NAD(P)-dependent oxidoreductase [Streptomyces katrae]|uniref:SDR family NAD(P)-dependent oxidoreductase n=1 Tax=Streptomyces katrae TaxID=68223 RepID=A0ABT7H1A9_9ACTN|nr:SDR family NAD(P)-dependent oxidoreductase [Streptomyces katrae]MDK9499673.1 SDR family NAD(P)-dependent oxidoreductase [Streptomyces katrae]